LQKKYEISDEEYQRIWKSQGEACAGCGRKPFPGRRSKFYAVDHDHAVEKIKGKRASVRALVCNWCNRIMGLLDRFKIKGTSLDRIRNEFPAQKILNSQES